MAEKKDGTISRAGGGVIEGNEFSISEPIATRDEMVRWYRTEPVAETFDGRKWWVCYWINKSGNSCVEAACIAREFLVRA